MKKVLFASVFIIALLTISSCGIQKYAAEKLEFSKSINPVTKNHVFDVYGKNLFDTTDIVKVTPEAEAHFYISNAKANIHVETADANFDWKQFLLDTYKKIAKAINKK